MHRPDSLCEDLLISSSNQKIGHAKQPPIVIRRVKTDMVIKQIQIGSQSLSQYIHDNNLSAGFLQKLKIILSGRRI